MAYYPSFALFSELPSIAVLADSMLTALGNDLTDLAVEVPGAYRLEADPERVRQLLGEPKADYLSLAGEQHCVAFWLVRREFVAIKLWDFDSELYDSLTDEMRQDKRRFALDLHAALIRAGAVLTYTESADEKSESSLDRADRVSAARAAGDVETLRREVQQSHPWVVAVRHGSAAAAGLDTWLSTRFARVLTSDDQGAVYEHLQERPFFLKKPAAYGTMPSS